MKQSDIAMVGLAVMGENLALNMESKGYTVTVYNRPPIRIVPVWWNILSMAGEKERIFSVRNRFRNW